LRRDIHHNCPKAYFEHPVNDGDDEEEARAFGRKDQPSQPEDDPSFVFPADLYRGSHENEDEKNECWNENHVISSFY
jgi:hypothetical protein